MGKAKIRLGEACVIIGRGEALPQAVWANYPRRDVRPEEIKSKLPPPPHRGVVIRFGVSDVTVPRSQSIHSGRYERYHYTNRFSNASHRLRFGTDPMKEFRLHKPIGRTGRRQIIVYAEIPTGTEVCLVF